MKAIETFLTTVVLTASLALPAVAATDASGIFTLPAPGPVTGTDYENPIVSKKTQPIGIPTSIAVSTLGLFTNFNFRIVRGSDVTFTFFHNSATTNTASAGASNVTAIVDLSPEGATWVTNAPILVAVTPTTNGISRVSQVTISGTNFGVNAYGRIRGMTNAGSTGNGAFYPSNVIVTTWRRLAQVQ